MSKKRQFRPYFSILQNGRNDKKIYLVSLKTKSVVKSMYMDWVSKRYFILAKIFLNKMKRKVIKGKSKQMGNYIHRYCHCSIVNTNED